MTEFHSLSLDYFPWLCLSFPSLPIHQTPGSDPALSSAPASGLSTPLAFLQAFPHFPQGVAVEFWFTPAQQEPCPGSLFPSLPALAHTGCSRHECPAKTGQRETTSAFLLSEVGAAPDKPILPTLPAAQLALVGEFREEEPHILSKGSAGSQFPSPRGLQWEVLEQGWNLPGVPGNTQGFMDCHLQRAEGSLVLRMYFPREHFVHWLCKWISQLWPGGF